MTAHGVTLVEQVTFLLGRHDPAEIFGSNPDAPPDEYESEAEEILSRLPAPLKSETQVLAIARAVFRQALGDEEEPDDEALRRAARDIYRVVDGA